jgi:hypothetical protein
MTSLILLHASSQAAKAAAAPGLRGYLLIFAAGVAVGVAAAAIRSSRRATVRRAGISVLAGLTLFAAAPSVLPYDHLVASAHVDGDQGIHEMHCHSSPGTCADAPIAFGPGQFVDSGPLIVVPVMMLVLVVAGSPLLVGVPVRPAVPPPVHARSS